MMKTKNFKADVISISQTNDSASSAKKFLDIKSVRHTSKSPIPSFGQARDYNIKTLCQTQNPISKLGLEAGNRTVNTLTPDFINAIGCKTGIVKAHLLPLQKVAADTQQIIAFRHVDGMSTGLIESGHPTKGFLIKGKSANHGPQAGNICFNQELSKLHNIKLSNVSEFYAQVNKYNKSVIECVKSGAAKVVKLSVSEQRLDFLKQQGIISYPSVSSSFIISSNGLEYVAIKNENGSYDINFKGEPLNVLADPKSEIPLTADYDLMFIAPETEKLELENADKLPVKMIHFDSVSEVYKKNYARHTSKDFTPKEFFKKEEETKGSYGEEIGNATPRIAKMIDVINQALVGDGFPVVHHNADSGSPATDPNTNYPITVFMPKGFSGYDSIHIIDNADKLKEFIQHAKDYGFHVPINPKWEANVAAVKKTSFHQAARVVSQMLSLVSAPPKER
ncbi:adenylate cyclase [Shewanella sp. WE21]|uniref:Adenylate cyclase toxin n=1 Tax=Shewanella baltica TaxID=62322 RepID=A0A2U8U9P6_9GAMM|nr:anthrax toxin-like adenylyl cyclase domain-containing protein [Shewanella sp. WE21]AVI67740.1 adenylate cyclase [Shewanella sp. WE21]AWM99294.1 adenylate cyclase toxin [Shewanella baltica]